MELKDLTPEQLNELKNAFDSAILSLIKEAQDELSFIKTEADTLRKQERELWEKQRLAVFPESSAIMEERMVLDKKIVELQNKILNQENIVFCLENGGMISSVTDKKGKEHTQIPDFRSVNTNQIYFDLETILTDKKPVYVPNIDEDNFRRRGYVFDAIRLDKDSYILAIKKHSEEEHTDYVLVTLDQLVLISDYYYTKAKAILLKEAQDKNKRSEEYWDKLPEEKRERFLNQKNLYHSLPVKIKKEITQENYEALDWKEKEKLYKFYKRYGSKKIVSKLGATEMWTSFHSMYERFIDPAAVPPKKGYGNAIVFEYWYAFREMMSYKINDIQIQRDDLSEMRKIALETSYGESNTSDVLKQEFGILVKRQNGDKINPMEIDQIKNAFASVQNIFGNLKNIAAKQNIKISHTGVRYCFASKAIGMYVPKMGTIAVSDKYGDVQFKMTLAHETGHFIDNYIGELNKKSYASNNYESTAGKIAFVFRDNMNKPKSKHNNYVNSTQECFARAMEQYYGIEAFGEDAGIAFSYVPLGKPRPFFVADDFIGKDAYYNKLKPLIIQFFTENEDIFKYTVDVNETTEPVPIGTENENIKNITDAIEVLTVLMELSTETQKQELQIKIDDLKGVLNSGSGSVFEKGGTIRRYNLPINDNYKLIDSFYTGGLENSLSCDNCGKPIANVATIKNTKGEIFNVGLDCAETLTHIDGLHNAKMDFEELKAIQAKIRKQEKEGKILSYEINNNGDLLVKSDGYTIVGKDINFAKKYMSTYLKKVTNPEKIGFTYVDKNINIPFDKFRASENINFIKEWNIDEYHIVVSVKPYFNMVTKQISGYDFYLDVDTNRKNIFSKRVTMYNNLPSDINYAIKSYLFEKYHNSNIMQEGGETQKQELQTKIDDLKGVISSSSVFANGGQVDYSNIFKQGFGKIKVPYISSSGNIEYEYFKNPNYSRKQQNESPTYTIDFSDELRNESVIKKQEYEQKTAEYNLENPIISIDEVAKEVAKRINGKIYHKSSSGSRYIRIIDKNGGETTIRISDHFILERDVLNPKLRYDYEFVQSYFRKNDIIEIVNQIQNNHDIIFEKGGEISPIFKTNYPVIDEVLIKAQPIIEKQTAEFIKTETERNSTPSKFAIQNYQLGLIYDLVKALSRYVDKTDELKNIDLSTEKGVLTISCNVIRNNQSYYLSTQIIYAGGYNVQRLHLRYIVDTNLPSVSTNTSADVIKEKIKNLTKIEKIKQEIAYFERRIIENNNRINAHKNWTDQEIISELKTKDNSLNVTWDIIVQRGADENYNNQADFDLKQKQYLDDAVKFWKNINIESPQKTNLLLLKEIEKLNKRLNQLEVDTFKNGGEINANEDLYQEWKELVNMSAAELEKFKNTPEGKKAGLTKTKAKQLGISSGQESSEWILKMKNTDVKNWTPEMWKWAAKQVAFIKRMSGVKGDLFNEKNEKTPKHNALLIWGHNPVKTKKLKKGDETKKVHDYCCAMLYFNNPKLSDIHSKIAEQDVYIDENDDSFGLDNEPHTTLLYGLHQEVADSDVFNTIKKHNIPNQINLENVSLFENEKYDVLKFDVNEPILHKINKDLAKYPHTNSYSDYHPHCTIAYLKKGKGKKYCNMFDDLKITVLPEKIVYSKTDGSKLTKSL